MADGGTMSVLDRDVSVSVETASPRERVQARSWLVHVVVLGLLLLVSSQLLGPGTYTYDESAYRAQTTQLVDEGTWAVPIVPGPSGITTLYAPLALSDVQPDGWFPYARHAAYPTALAVIDPLAPGQGGLLLSALSLIVVALVSGLATDRLPAVDGRLGFWLAASASPFLIHAHIGWAHLPATAAFAAAVAIIHHADRWSVVNAVAVAGCIFGVILLRTEGLVASAALFGAVALVQRSRPDWLRWLGTIGLSTCAAFALDRILFEWATGSVSFAPTGTAGVVEGVVTQRLQAATALFLDVGGQTPQHVARLLAALLLLTAAVLVRRRMELGLVVIISVLGLGLGLYGSAIGDPYAGLFAAWPVLLPALVLCRPAAAHRFPLAVLGLTWAGLVLVSPPDGGGLGWAGRLALITLAVAVPTVAQAVNTLRSRESMATGAGIVMGAALLLSLVVSVVGLAKIDSSRETATVIEEQVRSALAPLVGSNDVLISTDRRLGRSAPDVAVLLPLQSMSDDSELAEFLEMVDAASITRVVHIDFFDNDEPVIPTGWQANEATLDQSIRTIVIERMPS